MIDPGRLSTNLMEPERSALERPLLPRLLHEGLQNEDDAACRRPQLVNWRGLIDMGLILLVLLLVLIFAGAGFALHVLWIIAVVLLLVWLLGFLVSGAEHSWYRVQKK